jgi:hypothetical protein
MTVSVAKVATLQSDSRRITLPSIQFDVSLLDILLSAIVSYSFSQSESYWWRND